VTSRQGDLSRMSSAMSKRFSATQTAGKYVYMLTQVEDGEDGKDKDAGLVAVELASGGPAGQVLNLHCSALISFVDEP